MERFYIPVNQAGGLGEKQSILKAFFVLFNTNHIRKYICQM